MPLKEIGN